MIIYGTWMMTSLHSASLLDITLFSTTLRLGSNNEVAIINNGCIAGARITNCARSKNAIVIISMKLNIKFHDGDNVAKFKEAIGDYIKSNPEIWDSIVFIRCDDIDTGYAFVMYKIAVRSRHTWQASGRVLTDRGRLHQYCAEVATKMGVAYDLVWLRKSGEGESNEKKPNSPNARKRVIRIPFQIPSLQPYKMRIGRLLKGQQVNH